MRKITAMKATRTYLELTRPGQFQAAFGDFPDVLLERVERPTPELYATPGHSGPRACGSTPARSTTPTRCRTTRSAGSCHTKRNNTRQITEWDCFPVDSPA